MMTSFLNDGFDAADNDEDGYITCTGWHDRTIGWKRGRGAFPSTTRGSRTPDNHHAHRYDDDDHDYGHDEDDDDEHDCDDPHLSPNDNDSQCHPHPNQSSQIHHGHHLVIDDVESKDADGVDILLVAARPKPPIVAKG